MDVLGDYTLEDFLLFSPDVYWRLFELHNERFSYFIEASIISSVLLILFSMVGIRSTRFGAWMAALASGVVGWAYFLESYATINWAAVWLAPLFFVMAGSLALVGIRDASHFEAGRPRLVGLALLIYGCVGYPIQGIVMGRPLDAAQLFGLAPGPTAIAILGYLVCARSGWLAFPAVICAVAWCVVSALTHRAMDSAEAWPLFFCAAAALPALLGLQREAAD